MRAQNPPGFDQTAARREITLLTDDSDSRIRPPRCRSSRAIRPLCRRSSSERLQMQLILHGNQRVAMTRQRKRALDHPTQRKPADQRSADEQKRSAHAQNGGHDRKGQRMHEYGSGITDGIDRLNGASRTELAPPERAGVAV